MAIFYDPSDWYWSVTGVDNLVWSSKRLTYVGLDDADYAAWLALGYITTSTPSQDTLALVMAQQRVSTYLASGLQVVSTGNGALNATYALDEVTLTQVGAVARDAASGLGFPNGTTTFVYPDMTGMPHTFTTTELMDLYKALRDYVSSVNTSVALLARGNYILLPTQPVTID